MDRGRPRFRQGFSCLAVLRYRITESYTFRVRGFHPLSPAFPEPFHYIYDFLLRGLRPCGPTTPASAGLGSSNFARRYFRNHSHRSVLLFSLPGVREMVQFPQFRFRRLCIQRSDDRLSSAGLPHSAIQVSQDVCSSSWLFAAYHGLLRLATPRHPPMNPFSLDHIIVPALTLVRTSSSCPSLFAPLFRCAPCQIPSLASLSRVAAFLGLLVVSNSESPPLEIRGFAFESPIYSLSKTTWR